MTTLRNKTLIRRLYNDVLNNRHMYLLDELVSPDFVDHNPDPGQLKGIDGIRTMFAGFFESFPNLHANIISLVAENDLVCAHLEMVGTHLGTFHGIAPTGREVRVTGFDWARIDESGKIVERWGVFDNMNMMVQLGAAPAMPADELKKLSARYYELLDGGKGDLATIRAELFHPQHVTHFGGNALSIEAFQTTLTGYWKALGNLNHVIEAQVCENNVVYNRLLVTGKHVGDLAGVKATNKDVTFHAMTSHRWVEGKLIEQHLEVELVNVLAQIGAIELPTK